MTSEWTKRLYGVMRSDLNEARRH